MCFLRSLCCSSTTAIKISNNIKLHFTHKSKLLKRLFLIIRFYYFIVYYFIYSGLNIFAILVVYSYFHISVNVG